KPDLDSMGPGTDMAKPLFRKNDLDEMTVGRTEKPLGSDVKPVKRGKIGTGSYEDPGEQKRRGRRTGKTGKPGK
ncbi:MAG: hypothetical protein ABGW90_07940, partial [Martelella sp.]